MGVVGGLTKVRERILDLKGHVRELNNRCPPPPPPGLSRRPPRGVAGTIGSSLRCIIKCGTVPLYVRALKVRYLYFFYPQDSSYIKENQR